MLRLLRGVWHSGLLPSALRHKLRPTASMLVLRFVGNQIASADALARGPITISGFFGEVLGIGRAARLTADALETAGYQVIRHDIRTTLNAKGEATLPTRNCGVWLLHCNPPEAAIVMSRIPRAQWNARYRVGYWVYELPKAPENWLRFSRTFHEVWAPSSFVASALTGAACPVRLLPHPVPNTFATSRKGDPNQTRVIAFADLRSSAARKNPLGAVQAFLAAYPSAQERVELIVKIVQRSADPTSFGAIQASVAGRPDIRLIDSELSDAATIELLQQSDIFLSLHRSEGFGLAILEAMQAGCAVLATGWSGNLDFMSGMGDALVPYSLTQVYDPAGVYPAGALWAEPDIREAAIRLRRLASEPQLRAAQNSAAQANLSKLRTRWSAELLSKEPFSAWAARS